MIFADIVSKRRLIMDNRCIIAKFHRRWRNAQGGTASTNSRMHQSALLNVISGKAQQRTASHTPNNGVTTDHRCRGVYIPLLWRNAGKALP